MGQSRQTSELSAALRRSAAAFAGVAGISGLVNLLTLTGSFFMLEVYDRAIPSRSIPTLVGLCILALVLFVAQGALEALRARILARIGTALDADIGARVFYLSVRAPLYGVQSEEAGQPLRDLNQIRTFLSGTGPTALFDLPWLPAYVALCFLFHPLIGAVAIGGALLLGALTLLTDWTTLRPSRAASEHAAQRHALFEAARRNAEVVAAMGLHGALCRRWEAAHHDEIDAQQRTADIAGGFGAMSKACRMALQSGVLALGAWLVINGQASGGSIIAASILVARALAPVELAIANWKGFVAARQSWRRLSLALHHLPAATQPMALPAPRATLSVEAVSMMPPGTHLVAVYDASFRLTAGQALGIIGPSASGKSSLVRALVRVWTPLRGRVRLDGAALEQWSAEDLGPHIGYLPQETELFAGTVAENIARFQTDPKALAIVAAAKAAGVHEMILRLPEGYQTRLGDRGAGLSAGQRQRVGLARALYGDPFLVVLDEPNANLDSEGEVALTQAIRGIRARGGICVVVAHRPSALAAVDLVLLLADGRMQAFGTKEEVLRRISRPVDVARAEQPRKSA
ncbi:type I secretion system permease/ATPase [Methylobacterium pseudosasicola]|uniref:ATP-binding protein PrsD n=1 Tax=Methylobacterium pseudosasicola TaxID=582667 RepID=A0A1I4I3Z5_9HYPH|nr:type I secretion system permease/ATPase [Methylobacterium pseudosasicola]SFL48900.1 ATP-binding protein PrsD [Methylobacterium pseudosasicola]